MQKLLFVIKEFWKIKGGIYHYPQHTTSVSGTYIFHIFVSSPKYGDIVILFRGK